MGHMRMSGSCSIPHQLSEKKYYKVFLALIKAKADSTAWGSQADEFNQGKDLRRSQCQCQAVGCEYH